MSRNSFGDSMERDSARACSPRRGKRGGGGDGSSDKPKQPQRGLGVAQLEKIRIQSEMAVFLHPQLGQPPLVHRTASLNLEEARASTSLSSSPSCDFNSSPFTTHPNLAMEYRERGDMRYVEFQSVPVIRSSPSHNANIHGATHCSHPSITLPLFEPEESMCLRRQHDQSLSLDSTIASCMNSFDEQQDVDLELKL